MLTPFDKLNYIILLVLVGACKPISTNHILGLWQLEMVNVDGWERQVEPTFIDFKSDHSFAISQISGDHIGFYKLTGSKIFLKCEAGKWFDAGWNLSMINDHIVLNGLKMPYSVTELRFAKLSRIPDFAEFEERVIGKWKLYKVRQPQKVKHLDRTSLIIDADGYYQIEDESGVTEKGEVRINTRHHRVTFTNDEISWKAWFYGEELRLDSKERGIQYSLRKMD